MKENNKFLREELIDREDEITNLKKSCAVLKDACEFYCPSNSYDYDKTQGVNYIWNDQGKKAREALKAYDELMKGGGG